MIMNDYISRLGGMAIPGRQNESNLEFAIASDILRDEMPPGKRMFRVGESPARQPAAAGTCASCNMPRASSALKVSLRTILSPNANVETDRKD